MAIIVEDGTIVTDANSFLSEADADSYFEFERPSVTDWEDFDNKEPALRFATKLLGLQCWLGYRVQPSVQELSWPRNLVWDDERRQFIPNDEIPDWLKWATAEIALAAAREDRTLAGEEAGGSGLKRAKVDVLEVEWFPQAAKMAEKAKPLIPDIAMQFIEPYLSSLADGFTVKTLRT